MSKPVLASLWPNILAVGAIAAYLISQHPDRISFLFAAVMFAVNGAADRVISHVQQAAK